MNTHGGANRNQGRKRNKFQKKIAVIRCNDDDWEIIKSIPAEKRATILVSWWKQRNTQK